jgi:Na+-driven multidrug efflux pump
LQLTLVRSQFHIKENNLFTKKSIFQLFMPVLIEQAMIIAMGYADTIMVAYVGETEVAGISLVTTFDSFVKVMMTALSVGGCIVISQYIGKGEMTMQAKP